MAMATGTPPVISKRKSTLSIAFYPVKAKPHPPLPDAG